MLPARYDDDDDIYKEDELGRILKIYKNFKIYKNISRSDKCLKINISYGVNFHINEKLNKPSFGYYKSISVGKKKPASSDSHHTKEVIFKDIFSLHSNSFKKMVGETNRRGLEVSVQNGCHVSLCISKILHDSQNSHQLKSCQLINLFYFKKKISPFIYLFTHEGKRCDKHYY